MKKNSTTELLISIQKNMVTKEESKKFATKDEFKNYPTKDDLKNELKNYPTKDDLKNELRRFATKDDLDLLSFKIDQKFDLYATKNDLLEMKDEIITHIDSFLKMHERYDHELVSLKSKSDRLDDRLTVVERKIGI